MNYTIPSNVINVKYYNTKDINGKFMNCEIIADEGTEFLALPFTFGDGVKSECLVANVDQYISAKDKFGNPAYGICIVCSESFFKYFIPAFQYLGSKDVDDWKLRYEYVSFILNLFNDPDTKVKIIDYLDTNENKDINSLLITLDDGYVLLDRAKLYFNTIPLLKTIADDIKEVI